MTENIKTFPLRVVLTVTTDRLLTERKGPQDNGIGDLYEILNWLTGDSLYTHQLPRAVPTRHCLNLATAVSTILWDRQYKEYLNGRPVHLTPGEFERRGFHGFAM